MEKMVSAFNVKITFFWIDKRNASSNKMVAFMKEMSAGDVLLLSNLINLKTHARYRIVLKSIN